MAIAVAEDRLRRLVSSGLRGMCRPAERISQLRGRTRKIDVTTIARMEQVFFGLADKTRLMMLELLAKEELCSCEITAALDLTEPTTSHHLGILERVGLIASRREGKWVFYSLAPITKNMLTKGSALARGAT